MSGTTLGGVIKTRTPIIAAVLAHSVSGLVGSRDLTSLRAQPPGTDNGLVNDTVIIIKMSVSVSKCLFT